MVCELYSNVYKIGDSIDKFVIFIISRNNLSDKFFVISVTVE